MVVYKILASLKVSKSRKQIMMSSILPKKQTKNHYPEYFREDAQDSNFLAELRTP